MDGYTLTVRIIVFRIALSILMAGALLMGLIHRERHGIAHIGMESFLVIILYIRGLTILMFSQFSLSSG